MFKSQNGGASWSDVNGTFLTNTDVLALAVDPLTPGTLYAGTDSGAVYKSTNGGDTWEAASEGLGDVRYVSALAIDPQHPINLYAGTSEGVFKSTNGAVPGAWPTPVWALSM